MAALERLLPRLLKGRSPADLPITATRGNSKKWPTFPCSLWFETNEKVKAFCVNINCKFEEEREWHGRLVGKGIHGSVNALLAMLKHKNKTSQERRLFMGLLTICDGCCGQPDFCYEADHMDRIINEASGSLVLGLLEKEIEKVISSKEIIMEGMLMNAIMTIGVDGKSREWPILRPFFVN